jgi:CheY-like chemotaxis protein
MEEQETPLIKMASEDDHAADRPAEFVGENGTTALVCEPDPAAREKLGRGLKALGYQVTAAETTGEAMKAMRFHLFDVLVVNERFDTANPETNELLGYLENLKMATRRRLFVALISERYRTMDNMAAFNRSVNIVIHPGSIDHAGPIIGAGVADNKAFYRIFDETLQKMGRG